MVSSESSFILEKTNFKLSGAADFIRRGTAGYQLLNSADEVALGQKVQAMLAVQRSPEGSRRNSDHETVREGRNARDTFVLSNVRLAMAIARQRQFQEHGLDQDDLLQAAIIGLVHAVDKFDPNLGYKFSTYATWWVRQSLEREIANTGRAIRLPVHVHETIARVKILSFRLEEQFGRPPRLAELAKATDMEPSKLSFLINSSRDLLSLSLTLANDPDFTVTAIVESGHSLPENKVVRHIAADAITHVLNTLTPREAGIIRMRFGLLDGEPKTLEQIGREYSLTRERIRQIETVAISKLRHVSRSEPLRDYLSVWDD